jgi:sec-independent protein translocase protein TatC
VTVSHANRGEMPFLDHLEELRWRILKALVFVVVGVMLGFGAVHYLHFTELLIRPIAPYLEAQGGQLAAFSPLDPFMFELKLSLLVGLILVFPLVFFQLWSFFAPALEPHERRIIIPSLYFGLLLFLAGGSMAYFLLLPIAYKVLLTQFSTGYINLVIGAAHYFGFTVRFIIAFGLAFELPVVVMILTAFGLLSPKFLREKRAHAIVGIAVASAFITPGPDITSMMLMMGPMVVLYEISILLSGFIRSRKRDSDDEPIKPAEGPPVGAVEVER